MVEMGPVFNGWFIVAYVLMALGIIGAVVPVLPGPVLVWLGALVWAWADGFTHIGWGTLAVLGVLAASAWGADILLSTVLSRRAGASWKAILGAIGGGLVGALLLSFIPILGTLLGALLGAVAGMWAVEYWSKRDVAAATTAVRGYLVGVLAGAGVKAAISVLMIIIFAVQAWR
jgi:uncharacterized protein